MNDIKGWHRDWHNKEFAFKTMTVKELPWNVCAYKSMF